MPDYKKQHFVPQFYLRNFGRDERISLFHFAKKKHIHDIPVKDQCQGDYLYGEEPEIEKLLSELEDNSSEVIKNIIDSGTCPKPLTKEHIRLTTYMAFQHGRTIAAGENLEETATKTMRAAFSGKTTPEGYKLGDLKGVRLKHERPALYSLGFTAKSYPLFMDLKFKLIVNKSEIEFITSDAPVVLYNQWCEEVTWMGIRGFVSAGLQIFFPLSPRYLFLFYDWEIYDMDESEGGIIEIKSPKSIDTLNRLQLLSMDKVFYYSGDSKTRKKIDNFPFDWHWPPEKSIKVIKAVAEDPTKQLIVNFAQCQNARLRLPFLRIKTLLNKVPLDARIRTFRERAMKIDEKLRAAEPPIAEPDMEKVPRKFKVTEHF